LKIEYLDLEIEYLEAAFLIRVVHRIDHTAKKFRRANFFQVYLTNPCMRSAVFSPLPADDQAIGALVETGIFSQWFHAESPDLYYARWKDGEVDIVHLERQRPTWAVEVKWSDAHVASPQSLKSLSRFLREHPKCGASATTRSLVGSAEIEADPWSFSRPASTATNWDGTSSKGSETRGRLGSEGICQHRRFDENGQPILEDEEGQEQDYGGSVVIVPRGESA
jgi:hypothetical protein